MRAWPLTARLQRQNSAHPAESRQPFIPAKEAPMSAEAVIYEKEGAIAVITLNRPDTRNALSEDSCRGWWECLARWR
jgi:1,4-dihydroxy-2-naphthoyl-CoA synthase